MQVAKALDRHRVGIGIEDRPRVVVRVRAGLVRRQQRGLGSGDHGRSIDAALGAKRGDQILELAHECPDRGGRSAHARRSAASARTTRGAGIVTEDPLDASARLAFRPWPADPARPTRTVETPIDIRAPPPFRFSSPATSAAQRPRRRWPRRVVFGLLWFALAIVSAFYGFATAIAQDVQNLDAFQSRPTANGVIYAGDGTPCSRSCARRTRTASSSQSDQIAKVMKQAIVAIEDKRFYEHGGDRPDRPRARGRRRPADGAHAGRLDDHAAARQERLHQGAAHRCGASSSRPCSAATSSSKSWTQGHDPHRVPEHGVLRQPRLRRRGGRADLLRDHARSLQPWQAALLAGIVRAPTEYDPVAHPKAALARRNVVLAKMLQQKMLEPWTTRWTSRSHCCRSGTRCGCRPRPVASRRTSRSTSSEELVARYGVPTTFGGGLKVYTTIDLAMQKKARQHAEARRSSGRARPVRSSRSIPTTGQVKALVGGRDFSRQPVQRRDAGAPAARLGVQAVRPPAALERGIQPSTTFQSRPR